MATLPVRQGVLVATKSSLLMLNRELKSLIDDQRKLLGVRMILRSGIAAMSDELSGETNFQVLELQQKLSMAQEELEMVRTEADKQTQETKEIAEQAAQEVKQKADEAAVRVMELERELERSEHCVADLMKEHEQMLLQA